MSDSAIGMGGCLTFWDVHSTDAKKVEDGLSYLGLERHAPKPRTEGESLRIAMRNIARIMMPCQTTEKYSVDVKRLRKVDDGMEAILVHHRQEGNEYSCLFRARVERGGVHSELASSDHARLEENYWRLRKESSGAAVGKSLVQIMSTFYGACLRAVGGLYYIPQSHNDMWSYVTAVYEGANSANRITVARFVMNDSTRRAIKESIEKDICRAAERINKEVTAPDKEWSAAQYEAKKRELNRLQEMAERYRSILSDSLDACRQAIQEADSAAAIATMCHFGASERELAAAT